MVRTKQKLGYNYLAKIGFKRHDYRAAYEVCKADYESGNIEAVSILTTFYINLSQGHPENHALAKDSFYSSPTAEPIKTRP